MIQQISSDANRSFSPEKLKDRDRQIIKDKFSVSNSFILSKRKNNFFFIYIQIFYVNLQNIYIHFFIKKIQFLFTDFQ